MMRGASGEVGTPDSTASNPDWQESIAEIDGTYSIESLFGSRLHDCERVGLSGH
jgi:hypothetical protein